MAARAQGLGLSADLVVGSTRMEVSWTVGAALLLVVIAVVTFAKLGAINNPPDSGPGGVPVTKSGSFIAAGAQYFAQSSHHSTSRSAS